MSEEEGFLRALRENPGDRIVRLIYADWLEERQDSRAEYLRLLDSLSLLRVERVVSVPLDNLRDTLCESVLQLRQTIKQLENLHGVLDPDWRSAVRSGPVEPGLLVLRGCVPGLTYPLYEGLNFLGRADEKPVEVDLEEQEPTERRWCARQHACITWEDNQLLIEDLNSPNGTYLNRRRVYPGTKSTLGEFDLIQVGNVQFKVLLG